MYSLVRSGLFLRTTIHHSALVIVQVLPWGSDREMSDASRPSFVEQSFEGFARGLEEIVDGVFDALAKPLPLGLVGQILLPKISNLVVLSVQDGDRLTDLCTARGLDVEGEGMVCDGHGTVARQATIGR